MRLPRRLPARRALPLAAALVLPAMLAGCGGPGRDEFAPACPVARPLPEATQLQRYRDPDRPGGRDPSQLVVSGVFVGATGACRPGDNAHTLAATLRLQMQLTRGPAAPPGGVEVPYFVAVARGQRILTKQVYATHVAFPADSDQVTLTSAPLALKLPVSGQETGASYTIWVGFQLTPAEFTAEGGR